MGRRKRGWGDGRMGGTGQGGLGGPSVPQSAVEAPTKRTPRGTQPGEEGRVLLLTLLLGDIWATRQRSKEIKEFEAEFLNKQE